jgi:hypothetical protein
LPFAGSVSDYDLFFVTVLELSMLAKIYQPAKTAMQSGKAKSDVWVLELQGSGRRTIDPLMGWTGVENGQMQTQLTFETRDAAIHYAKREGLTFRVVESRKPKRIVKTYADNFSANRKFPWTH